MIEREVVTAGVVARGASDVDRQAAFARLIDHSLVSSYRLAVVLLGSEVEAQDALQDAAVAAWERFGDLREQDRFEAWFQRILVNCCRSGLRRRRRVRLVEIDDRDALPGADDTQRFAERDALSRALESLSAAHREVVVLRFLADLSLEAIAERTGERLGTVKSRLHYAIESLHAAYDAADREGSR